MEGRRRKVPHIWAIVLILARDAADDAILYL